MANTLYDALKNLTVSGNYSIETEYATIPIEFIMIASNTVYSVNTNLGNATPDTHMLVVHYTGNLTINNDVTVTASARKRGMVIIVDGDCSIIGNLTMTARGANTSIPTYPSLMESERSQRILIVQSGGTDYEIPTFGGLGGLGKYAKSTFANGNVGGIGVNGGTGGGGSGGTRSSGTTTYGADGAQGTSFSGGSASGGTFGYISGTATNTSLPGLYGGSGGNAYQSGGSGGGGAGNPLGLRIDGGTNGTGGLLILIVEGNLNIIGVISSNGSKGGYSTANSEGPGGGSSGGGSVNVFYKGSLSNVGSVIANGGLPQTTPNPDGGAGGNGTARIIQIIGNIVTAKKRRFAQII